MLVLTRKCAETIQIGDDITITVLRCGPKAKIGVQAPKATRVVRGELLAGDPTAVPIDEPLSTEPLIKEADSK